MMPGPGDSLRKYVGIPFKAGGRSFKEVDCYGLVRLFYLHELHVELPTFDLYNSVGDPVIYMLLSAEEARWEEIQLDVRSPYDVLLYQVKLERGGAIIPHMGVWIPPHHILHQTIHAYSACLDLNGLHQWRLDGARFVGVFRRKLGAGPSHG